LPNDDIISITIDVNNNKWIGTFGGGLAVFREGGILEVKDRINTTSSEFTLRQNYPNPFKPSTKIRFEIRDLGFVTLKVFDVLGREVATLINEVKQPGSYDVEWNAGGMPSGVYFYRLVASPSTNSGRHYVEMKKMLLLR
jgi:hypothetical protein